MTTRKVHGFFRDEQGDKSLARVCCVLWLGFTAGIVSGSWFMNRELSDGALGLLGTVAAALITWAGAPRVARYLRRGHSPPMEGQ